MSFILKDGGKFLTIPDTYGHLAGDFVLITFSGYIQTFLRKSDVFGRYGGEEFVIALPETSYRTAKGLANRIRGNLESKKLQYEENNFYNR